MEKKDIQAEYTITPSFEQKLTDTEVTEAFDVTFTVIVKGNPEPQISWLVSFFSLDNKIIIFM